MKKVKIILSAITVLAAVGGALAFKAKTYNQQYCIRAGNAGTCTTGLITSLKAPVGDATYFYTTTNNINNCSQASPTVRCAKVADGLDEPI